MKPLHEFDIEFIRLKEGEHHFRFSITEEFLKAFDSSLQTREMEVSLTFIKTGGTFTLHFDLSGYIETECDRCLSGFSLPVKGKHTLLVRVTDGASESGDDDLMFIGSNEHKINVAQQVYDLISLSVPLRKTCGDVGLTCDPAVIQKISTPEDSETGEEPGRETDIEEETT